VCAILLSGRMTSVPPSVTLPLVAVARPDLVDEADAVQTRPTELSLG